MSEPTRSCHSETRATRIRAFVLERFPLARQTGLDDAHSLLDSGVIDSLGILELVDFLTAEFDIPIDDDDLTPENFDSIRSLVAFVESKSSRP